MDLYVTLRTVERRGYWRNGDHGHEKFERFIDANFPDNVFQMRKYRKVKDAIDLFGEDDVRKVGVDGVVVLMRKEIVEDESGRKKVWRKIDAYAIEHRVAPPPAVIRQIVRDVFPPPSVKSGSKTTSSREEVVEARALEQENAALREEVAALRRKNVELEMRVEELKSENEHLSGKKVRRKAA